MLKHLRIVWISLCMVVLFAVPSVAASEKPGISDILQKKAAPQAAVLRPLWAIPFAAIVGLGVFYFSVRKKRIKSSHAEAPLPEIKKITAPLVNLEGKTARIAENPVEEEKPNRFYSQYSEFRKENEALKEKQRILQEQVKKYEDSIKSFLTVENTLKKSNQLLLNRYEKAQSEREGMLLELNRYKHEIDGVKGMGDAAGLFPVLAKKKNGDGQKRTAKKSMKEKSGG